MIALAAFLFANPGSADDAEKNPKKVTASQKQTGAKSDIGTGEMNRLKNQKDAKYQVTDKPIPEKDPTLAEFGIFAADAPNPEKTAPVMRSPSAARSG